MKQVKESAARVDAPKTAATGQRIESTIPESVRREHERFSVELEVSLGSEHNFYAGLAENLSAGGVFIATHQLKPVGSTIELTINLPDGVQIRANGLVR